MAGLRRAAETDEGRTMRVKAIINPAAGPNPPLPRALRDKAGCMPPEVPEAQAALLASPKSASTV